METLLAGFRPTSAIDALASRTDQPGWKGDEGGQGVGRSSARPKTREPLGYWVEATVAYASSLRVRGYANGKQDAYPIGAS